VAMMKRGKTYTTDPKTNLSDYKKKLDIFFYPYISPQMITDSLYFPGQFVNNMIFRSVEIPVMPQSFARFDF
jgi:hypothetical protein